MIISDLETSGLVPEETVVFGGRSAVGVGVLAEALGQYTRTNAETFSVARDLPFGGSIAFGFGNILAFAYTPPSLP